MTRLNLFSFVLFLTASVACGGSQDAPDESSEGTGALTNRGGGSVCAETSTEVCTPAPESELRARIVKVLRGHVEKELNIPAASGDPSFVFEQFRVQGEEKQAPAGGYAYVSGKMVTHADTSVPIKMTGKYAGKRPVFEALLEVPSLGAASTSAGTVLKLAIDERGDIAMCWRRDLQQSSPGDYPIGASLIPNASGCHENAP